VPHGLSLSFSSSQAAGLTASTMAEPLSAPLAVTMEDTPEQAADEVRTELEPPAMEAMGIEIVDAEVIKTKRRSTRKGSNSKRKSFGLHRNAGWEFSKALQKLDGLLELKVAQKHQLMEQQKFCLQQTKYLIYDQMARPKKGAPPAAELFYVEMEHQGVACVPGDCRHWSIDFFDLPEEGLQDGEVGEHFMRVERHGSINCCTTTPAVITEQPSGRVLGQLADPGSCRACYVKYQLMDSQEVVWLDTSICTPCKMGPCCRCPGCKVDFSIQDVEADRIDTRSPR